MAVGVDFWSLSSTHSHTHTQLDTLEHTLTHTHTDNMVRGYFVVAGANVAYAQYLYYCFICEERRERERKLWRERGGGESEGEGAHPKPSRVDSSWSWSWSSEAVAVVHATCPSYGWTCVRVCVCVLGKEKRHQLWQTNATRKTKTPFALNSNVQHQ